MSATDHAVTLLGDRTPRFAEQSIDGAEASTFATSTATDQITLAAGPFSTTTANDLRAWSRRHLRQLVIFDALFGAVAACLAGLLPPTAQPDSAASWAALITIGAVIWPTVITVSSGYLRRHVGVSTHQIMPVLRALAITIVLTAIPAGWLGLDRALSLVAVAGPVAALSSVGLRAGWQQLLLFRQRSGTHRRRMILVGSVDSLWHLNELINDHEPGIDVVGVCVPAAEMSRAHTIGVPFVADLDHVAAAASELDCHAVTVAGSGAEPDYLRQLAWSLEDVGADVMVHPGVVDVARPRMHLQPYHRLSLLRVEQPRFSGWRRGVKRVLDLAFTTLGLLVIWPIVAVVAALIKIEDRGPVFFKQTRIGVDGKPFTMYKFRSMVTDAERRLADLVTQNEGSGPLFKMERDPRITKIGTFIRRFSIDELPQLINVLRGNMSLVGPRPALQSEVDEYAEHVRRRLKVTPGLTGLWQVSGRSLLSWEESVRLDLSYVENWSVALDLRILSRTVTAVLASRGAF